MKSVVFILLAILTSYIARTQNGGIGTTTPNINASNTAKNGMSNVAKWNAGI